MPKKQSKPVVWTEEAARNLESIFDHIVKNFSVMIASETVTEIIEAVENLSSFPRKGKISEQYNEIRELMVLENTVYYRINEEDLVIASIRPRRTKPKSKM
jgi:plasmid stabilization system protein ParE